MAGGQRYAPPTWLCHADVRASSGIKFERSVKPCSIMLRRSFCLAFCTTTAN